MESNILVMSEAGKPIFARREDEGTSRLCGLLQAIRTSTTSNDNFDLGDIQSLRSGKLCIVFMAVQSISLVAISRSQEDGVNETEAYLRLQLEYVFAQLIFTLTEQVQNVFQHNPSFDLRTMLTDNDSLIHGILDESGPNGNAGPFLASGVQSVFPISHRLRERASRTLRLIGGKTENTAFALLIVGEKLLTVVQPAFRPHQIRCSDLHLILNFVTRQPGLLSSELWIPMCLPRFNSSGFLYAYTNCLDAASKLSLVLISPVNSTEQFQLFREAATHIREKLGLPAPYSSVLTIVNSDNKEGDKPKIDIEWRRSASGGSDEDYVNISDDGEVVTEECTLLEEIKHTSDSAVIDNIIKDCIGDDSMLHFLFRIDVAVKNRSKDSVNSKGNLTQCISPPLPFPFESAASKRRVWSNYQKMSLRLRLGSATVEATMDAFDMISQDETTSADEGFPGIAKYCPAISLLESPPNVHGVTHIVEGSEIFLAMNGRGFELHMVAPSSVPLKRAAALGARLVRRLMVDEKNLFLSNPLTWKE